MLSISFHDGQVLINYPWDDCPGALEGEKAPCSDDDVFKYLASLYADYHPFMWTGYAFVKMTVIFVKCSQKYSIELK